MNATRKFFDGLVEARNVEPNIWTISCKGVELGTIENHKGDRDWIADCRWEVWGTTVRFGVAGRHLLHRYSHGFATLESAVTELCAWKSGLIVTLA